MPISGVIHFIKLQNDTQTTIKRFGSCSRTQAVIVVSDFCRFSVYEASRQGIPSTVALLDFDHVALRPQKRGCLLGTGPGGGGGGGGKEGERVKARLRYRPKKTGETTSALRICCFKMPCWAESQGQCPMHDALLLMNKQPEAKEVRLSQPSSTSLLMSGASLVRRLYPAPPLPQRRGKAESAAPCLRSDGDVWQTPLTGWWEEEGCDR